jgi:dienelactone hydrolase
VNIDMRSSSIALATMALAVVALADPIAWGTAGTTSDTAQERISFSTRDGARIHADLYGTGAQGVVLAHGGRFNKESWREQVPHLVAAGFRVLAIDFRGYGQSEAPAKGSPADETRYLDVLGAVDYLRQAGATTVSVVGASMGGDYAAEAAEASPDGIDSLVLIAAGAYTPLIESKARKLFIMSRDDVIGDHEPRLPRIHRQYENASEPKAFVVLEGSAHAQHIFGTSQGDRLMREILRFLSTP